MSAAPFMLLTVATSLEPTTMNVATGASASATSEMNHMNMINYHQPAAFNLKGRSPAN
jgi:hypothetical protein